MQGSLKKPANPPIGIVVGYLSLYIYGHTGQVSLCQTRRNAFMSNIGVTFMQDILFEIICITMYATADVGMGNFE